MAIWFDPSLTLEKLRHFGKGFMPGYLDIECVELGDDFLKMSMPVVAKTQQPYGLLHGGASCVLAETAGSVASALVLDMSRHYCVGLEINANHLRGVRNGKVTATARPLHLGRTTHVWDIRIQDDSGALVCISRLTTAIIPNEGNRFSITGD